MRGGEHTDKVRVGMVRCDPHAFYSYVNIHFFRGVLDDALKRCARNSER